ncbi:phage tail protein [Clostridioides sp. GD02376]|uniref:phage tail protein n=2 Tax=unclassified Clostridioides TaxID=2635829 RepID=UPI00389DA63B
MATEKSYYTILTNVGKAKIANASIVGEKVDFAKIQLGDGAGSEYNPTEEQTVLKNVVWEGNVGNVKTDEDLANCLILESLIPANAGGFIVREIGYLDTEGNLLAISKYRSAYKPRLEDGAVIDMKVKTIFVVSNVNNIELKIDPTIIFATLKDLQDLEAKIDTVDTKIDTTKTELVSNIETTKTELNNKIGDTTLLETTDKTNIVSALNEVKTSVDSIETTAEKTSYNNATSNLTATNVQGAIDEVIAKIEKFNDENIKIQNSMLPI